MFYIVASLFWGGGAVGRWGGRSDLTGGRWSLIPTSAFSLWLCVVLAEADEETPDPHSKARTKVGSAEHLGNTVKGGTSLRVGPMQGRP